MEKSTARPRWDLVPLVLLVGLGSHTISHALAPSEPLLASLGLGPISYALLTQIPHLSQVFTPALWGWFFAADMRLAMAIAPSALVFGQTLLAIGLLLVTKDMGWSAAPVLIVGLLLSACSKSGLSVLQHSCLALVLPNRGTPSAGEETSGRLVGGLCLTSKKMWDLVAKVIGVSAEAEEEKRKDGKGKDGKSSDQGLPALKQIPVVFEVIGPQEQAAATLADLADDDLDLQDEIIDANGVAPLLSAQLGWETRLADGRAHRMRVRHLERADQLEVYLDDMADPLLFVTQLALGSALDADGAAYVGFTAASDDAGDAVHELLDWRLSTLDAIPIEALEPQHRTARLPG